MAEVLTFLDVYFTAPIYASQDPTRSSYHSKKKKGDTVRILTYFSVSLHSA